MYVKYDVQRNIFMLMMLTNKLITQGEQKFLVNGCKKGAALCWK